MQPQPSFLGWNKGFCTRWGTDSVGPPLTQAHGREAAVVNGFVPGAKSNEEISDTANQSKMHH